jgi:hypothetical protein
MIPDLDSWRVATVLVRLAAGGSANGKRMVRT